MRNRDRILIFVQSGVGGAERMSVLVGKECFNSGYEVKFCVVKRNTHDAPIIDFIPDKMDVRYINNRNVLFLLFSMFWVIVKEQPLTIFSSVINLNNKLLILKKIFGRTKFVIRCDNYIYTYTSKQQNILRKTYPLADKIIAQTEEMRDELLCIPKIDSSKVVVLHNPLDTKTIDIKTLNCKSPFPDDKKKHIVAIGRFSYQKGFDLLLQSFAKICSITNEIELYLVGDYEINGKDVYEQIMEYANNNKIAEYVHCVGYKDNPYIYLKMADCFVLSSRWEGLPNVLIESLYLGTPVAAFKCIPIIERIINNGVNGYLADKENTTELADAILKTLPLGRVKTSYKPSDIKDFVTLLK